MIEYLIESTFCLLIFYLVFEALFKRSRNYQMNRLVLLFSVLFSLLIPLFQIPATVWPVQEMVADNDFITGIITSSDTLNMNQVVKGTSNRLLTFPFILFVTYFLITTVLLIRFVTQLGLLSSKLRKSDKGIYLGHEVVLLDRKISPFTFFNTICISKDEYQRGVLDKELLLHEQAHKNQRHSIDIIIIQLLQVFFWFNPFIYIFKRLIKINHEYLADDYVLRSGTSSSDYINKLLHHTFPHKMSGLASGFNHVLIKQRLIMLSKFQSTKPLAYRFLLLIPVAIVLFTTTAFKSTTNILPDTLLNQVESNPTLYTPGTLYANTIQWSSLDKKVYLAGKKIKVNHGDNRVTVNGRASYLGKVHYLTFNGEPVTPDAFIDVAGKKCHVVKLKKEDAIKKYGSKGKLGAVEITIVQ